MLPIIHPEKVLCKRFGLSVWRKLKKTNLSNFCETELKIYNHYCSSLFKSAGEMNNFVLNLGAFINNPKVIVPSSNFITESTKRKTDLYRALFDAVINKGATFSGCIILGTGDYQRQYLYCYLSKSETTKNAILINFIQFDDSPDYEAIYFLQDFTFDESGLKSSYFPKTDKIAERLILLSNQDTTLPTIFCVFGYEADPTIIPHEFKPSKKRYDEKEPKEETERYTVDITYLTPATYKDRIYRVLNSSVRGYTRKQPCGPGRLHIKDVFIKEHSRTYKNE